jgi:hypothetical protein
MKILCRTLFDITATGVTGHFKSSRVPFQDAGGNTVTDEMSWNRSRNQQRNWETLTQLLQLRSQIFELSDPLKNNSEWQFDFETEIDKLYWLDGDEFGILRQDCAGVPMITGLDEQHFLDNRLVVSGTQQNIWFETAHK